MVNFGEPCCQNYWDSLDDVRHLSARWTVDNFNTAAPTFHWGKEVEDALSYRILFVSGLTVHVIGAAKDVTVEPHMLTHYGDTHGQCLGYRLTEKLAQAMHFSGELLPIAFDHRDGQQAGYLEIGDYAATDDLEMGLWGYGVKQSKYLGETQRKRDRAEGDEGKGTTAGSPAGGPVYPQRQWAGRWLTPGH